MSDPNRQTPNGPSSLIVVGAGSAGCVLASRLAREFGVRVVLLEPPSTESPRIDRERPSRWLHQLGSDDDWNLKARPSENLAARSIAWPRGKGLGGSSRINAMIWFPPTPADFRMLCEATNGRWDPVELEALYQQVDSIVMPERASWLSEPSRHFLEAIRGVQGASPMVYRRLNRKGRRWLPSELLVDSDPRIKVVRGIADHLIWDQDSVIGIHVRNEQEEFDLYASRGVVLSAGTVATPAILMRSGIGERDELLRHGIEVRVDSPSVGHHLRDHLIMPVVFQRHASRQPFPAEPTTRDLARWQVMGTGPIVSNLAECGGTLDDQSIQLHVTPTHYLTFPKESSVPSMTIGVNVTQPRSTGYLRLGSKCVTETPEIAPQYLHEQADLAGTIRGVRLARQIAEQSPLFESLRCESIPGSRRSSDEDLARAIARYAQTLYHPIGTCRVGFGEDSVIDHNFAVRGTGHLWVVDASVLPQETIGNPNATVMTLAWFAAARIADFR